MRSKRQHLGTDKNTVSYGWYQAFWWNRCRSHHGALSHLCRSMPYVSRRLSQMAGCRIQRAIIVQELQWWLERKYRNRIKEVLLAMLNGLMLGFTICYTFTQRRFTSINSHIHRTIYRHYFAGLIGTSVSSYTSVV
jgi:hypothetical protein